MTVKQERRLRAWRRTFARRAWGQGHPVVEHDSGAFCIYPIARLPWLGPTWVEDMKGAGNIVVIGYGPATMAASR